VLRGSGTVGGRLTRDEENRAFRPLEQFRRNLTEEKLVARPTQVFHRVPESWEF
jgi:hypothetical protein